MKVYVIGGKAKCGKSSFGNFLREELKDYGHKPCVMHITGPLYGYAKNYFDWEEGDEKPREFLQKMGIEIIKEKMGKDNFLLDRLFEDIEILENFFDTFIITDARLIKEFEFIKSKYLDVVTIKIVRPDFDPELNEEEAHHITETEIDNYDKFDYVIENKGLDELKEAAVELIRNEETGE